MILTSFRNALNSMEEIGFPNFWVLLVKLIIKYSKTGNCFPKQVSKLITKKIRKVLDRLM